MPLGMREVFIAFRARDYASRTIMGVGASMGMLGAQTKLTGAQMGMAGAAMTSVGIIATGVGLGILAGFNSAAKGAAEWEKQVALTRTQTDKAQTSMEELSRVGLEIGKTYAVSFEDIQPTLYDIYSSMDVTAAQAETMLQRIARASVAGNVTMQDAGRGIISIMNAYDLKFKDSQHVTDVMFQMVKKGVGTYEEFTSVIGRAVPQAVAANQNLETLAGSMAFLTRNGLSTAMAATAAGRAMELMAKPDVTKNLIDYGIAVKDASGNFRPINDIVSQLANNKGWKSLTGPELAIQFKKIFGTGTVQARRFFNTAIKDSGSLNSLTLAMSDANGLAADSYTRLADTAANKSQLLTNKIKAYKVELGTQLLPMKLKLVSAMSKLLELWTHLNPKVRNAIMIFTGLVAVFLAVVGPILVLTGMILVLAGAFMMMGITVSFAIWPITLAVLAFFAIVAAIAAVIAYWDEVSSFFSRLGEIIMQWASNTWQWIQGAWDAVLNFVKNLPGTLMHWGKKALDAYIGFYVMIWDTMWSIGAGIVNAVIGFGKAVVDFVIGLPGMIVSGIVALAKMGANLALALLNGFINSIPTIIAFIGHLPMLIVSLLIDGLGYILLGAAYLLVYLVKGFTLGLKLIKKFWLELVPKIIMWMINASISLINMGLDFMKAIYRGILNGAEAVFNFFKSIPVKILNFLVNVIAQLAQWGQNIMNAILNAIIQGAIAVFNWFKNLPQTLINFVTETIPAFGRWTNDLMNSALNGLIDGAKALFNWVKDLPRKILDTLGDVGSYLFKAGQDLMKGFFDGLKEIFGKIKDWAGRIGGVLSEIKGPKAYDLKVLTPNGRWIMAGLEKGLDQGWMDIQRKVGTMSSQFGSMEFAGPQVAMGAAGVSGVNISQGAIQITIQGNADQATIDSLSQVIDSKLRGIIQVAGMRA